MFVSSKWSREINVETFPLQQKIQHGKSEKEKEGYEYQAKILKIIEMQIITKL